jgi:nicotinamidase-related amidase
MKILIVVDMQTDFIDGALGTPEAQTIVPNVIKKVEQYREDENGFILYTADTHGKNYLDTQEGKKLPVPHCIHPSKGWMIPEDIYVPNSPIVMKYTFGAESLPCYLRAIERQVGSDIESIEFIGLCTDICVISNVMIAKSCYPEVSIIVDSSCCAGVTPASHKNALEAMKMCQIEVI